MSNPVLNQNVFRSSEQDYNALKSGVMTLQGTINKTFLLLFLCVAAACFSWSNAQIFAPLMWPVVIAGFVLALIICFKPNTAPFLSPVYAVLEGIFLGVISLAFAAQYQNIVFQAVGITIAVFFVMLFLYKARIIKVTQGFMRAVVSATAGVAIFYLVTIALSLFGMNTSYMYAGGALGIGLSVVICAIAALNLMLDFNFIEQMSATQGAPKYYEWYGAFGLMVTLIWLYLEILRLLAKTNRK